jgi:hypothetical protein
MYIGEIRKISVIRGSNTNIMKKLLIFTGFLSLFAFAFTPYNTESNPTTPEEDWVELINGKDFTGWKVATENSATWTVENGLFQAVGKRSHLFYEGEHLKDGFKIPTTSPTASPSKNPYF